MKKEKSSAMGTPYTFEGRIPLKQAIPLGLQHVMAMFVGNLTPLLIIMGACGLTADAGYGALRTALLQNAMTVAGIVTLVQMFSIGPIGGKVPIVMGTSSGFLGVFKSVTAVLGQGALTYGAILGATIVGGLFEGVLGVCLKPLRKFFPSVVTGCVVMAIGLSLIPVGINYLCGGSGTNDYGSIQNLFLGMVVLIVTLALKHFTNPKGILSTASILIGILVGYAVAIIMTMVLPHTGTAVLEDGSTVSYTYSWVVNFQQVKDASWFALPGIAGFGKLAEVKPVFRECPMERLLVKNAAKCRMTEQMELKEDKEKVLQICSCEGKVLLERQEIKPDGVLAEGTVEVNILYITPDDHMPVGAVQEIYPFSQLVEIPEMSAQAKVELDASLEQLSAVMLDQEHVEIRAAVRLDLIAFVQEVIQNIEEATESEPDLEMLRNRPGLVGYIAKAGDDLWTIARENHTTIQNIMETNHRKSEVLLAGEKVLIVKQVG